MRHPDLDKAWADYDAAVSKLTEDIRIAIARQFDAAAAKGDLDQADNWQKVQDKFEKRGLLPTEDATKPAVTAATKELKSARDALQTAYEAVVKSLTMEKKIAEAKQVREEWLKLNQENPPRVTAKIPKDAITIGKHSYYLYLDAMTQEDARAACKRVGGYLAQITEPEEFSYLQKRLLPERRELRFWIDGTDARQEGKWTHLDGSPLQFLPWVPGEPSGRWDGREEDGLIIWLIRPNGGAWQLGINDAPQNDACGFICEWDEQP